jgi:hypothetical protein
MRGLIWLVLAVMGASLMVFSYHRLLRGDPDAPWAFGFLCIGEGEPKKPLEIGERLSTRLRFLPASELAGGLLKGMGEVASTNRRALEARLRPKLIELPVGSMNLLIGRLEEGRMPDPGANEILAGCQVPEDDSLTVGGETLKIVGVLDRSVALFASCYLVPSQEGNARLFPKEESSVQPVTIVRLTAPEFGDRKVLAQVMESFPSESFTVLSPSIRPDRRAFLAYLTAQGMFLLGGTGLLIGLYRWLAGRLGGSVLAAPLREIDRRPGLVWAVHLVYFGLFIIGALIIYQTPELHTAMIAAVQGELGREGKGVLAVAGKAYGSGNMLYASAVTFVINFFLGSFAMITLPSMIVPGIGALLAVFRATLWGLLLGPSDVSLALAMLPHSGTLLLEGEGYILATFFAILIPVYLLGARPPIEKPPVADDWEESQAEGPAEPVTTGQRFKYALLLNLKANVLVAIVLIVAACYEAFEVITMAGL